MNSIKLLLCIGINMTLLLLSACGAGNQYIVPHPSSDPLYAKTSPPVKSSSAVEITDTRINTVRRYGAYWAGLHVGDMFVEVKPKTYTVPSGENVKGQEFLILLRSYNLAKLISGFKSDTLSLMHLMEDGSYKPYDYSTSFDMKKKHRDIILKYSEIGDKIVAESNVPPEKKWKRKAVVDELKVNAPDPLTYVFQVREKIRDIVTNGGDNRFTMPLYDGRRRSDFLFTVYGITKDNLIHITFEERPVAGYTDNELKGFKKGGLIFDVYLSQDDLLPIWAEGYSFIGTAKIILKKYCSTLEECLDDED